MEKMKLLAQLKGLQSMEPDKKSKYHLNLEEPLITNIVTFYKTMRISGN